MTYELSDAERDGVLSASPELQYAHLLNRLADWKQAWALHNGQAFAAAWVEPDDQELFLLWPHPRYAQEAQDVGDGFEPKAIEVHELIDFVEQVLVPDGVLIAGMWTDREHYFTVEPADFSRHLREQLSAVE